MEMTPYLTFKVIAKPPSDSISSVSAEPSAGFSGTRVRRTPIKFLPTGKTR
jgi:hypothetical protein